MLAKKKYIWEKLLEEWDYSANKHKNCIKTDVPEDGSVSNLIASAT